jgi:MobI protein
MDIFTMDDFNEYLDAEIRQLVFNAKWLVEYYKVARKFDEETGEPRNEWSKYVLRLQDQAGKWPLLVWCRVMPVKMTGPDGKKVVKPRYGSVKRGHKKKGDSKLRKDDPYFNYPMSCFKDAEEWELRLIEDVESIAAVYRQQLWHLRVLKKHVEAYLIDAARISRATDRVLAELKLKLGGKLPGFD